MPNKRYQGVLKKKVRYTSVSAEVLHLYRNFITREGSEYIATPVTLQALYEIVRDEDVKRALEMGAGIGTISYLLLKFSDAHIDLYEDNDFCKNALIQNLKNFEGRYTLFDSYTKKPPYQSYDLFIVDGGNGKSHDGGALRSVQFLARVVIGNPIFYVEGYRHTQRTLLRKILRKRFIYSIVEYADTVLDGEEFKGGTAIYCKTSNNPFLRFVSYYYWEVVEFTGIKNAIKYRLKNIFRFISFLP